MMKYDLESSEIGSKNIANRIEYEGA